MQTPSDNQKCVFTMVMNCYVTCECEQKHNLFCPQTCEVDFPICEEVTASQNVL